MTHTAFFVRRLDTFLVVIEKYKNTWISWCMAAQSSTLALRIMWFSNSISLFWPGLFNSCFYANRMEPFLCTQHVQRLSVTDGRCREIIKTRTCARLILWCNLFSLWTRYLKKRGLTSLNSTSTIVLLMLERKFNFKKTH